MQSCARSPLALFSLGVPDSNSATLLGHRVEKIARVRPPIEGMHSLKTILLRDAQMVASY